MNIESITRIVGVGRNTIEANLMKDGGWILSYIGAEEFEEITGTLSEIVMHLVVKEECHAIVFGQST